jgi:4-hydroxyphenylacetate 3-monooxygenase
MSGSSFAARAWCRPCAPIPTTFSSCRRPTSPTVRKLCNGLYNRTGIMPQIMHQFSTKNLAKAEFMMGLAFAVAKSTNIDQHLHVQGMLAELIQYAEFCRASLRASEADTAPGPAGVMTPAAMPLWMVRMMFPKMFVRICEIIQILGAGGLVAVPSYAELDGPAAADVATYFQAANADSAMRIKLFRLAFDAAVSSFSGRQQLYERYYSGDPVRLAGTLYALYDKDAHIDRIVAMLDEIEAHNPPPIAGEG